MEKHKFLVRLHNLPRNSSLCQILHFIWEAVDFEPDEALIKAYSANDAIIGFLKKQIADEIVRYCNGRGWYGRIISVSYSNENELQQIIEEAKVAGPDKGPQRLSRRKNIEDEIFNDENKNDLDEENFDLAFIGLDNYSDSDSEDLDLIVPEYFLHGSAPDTINFNNSHKRPRKKKNNGQKSLKSMQKSSFKTLNKSSNNGVESIDNLSKKKVDKRKSDLSKELSSSYQKLIGKRLRCESASDSPFHSPLSTSKNSSIQNVPNSIAKRYSLDTSPQRPPVQPIQSARSNECIYPNSNKIPVRQSLPMPSFHQSPQSRWIPPPISFPQLSPSGSTCSNFSIREPVHFDIQLTISSQHCLLKWNIPDDIYINSQLFEISGSNDEKIIQRLSREKKYLQKVTPGTKYSAKIQGFDAEGKECALSCTDYRAYFSKSELENLMRLALKFCGDLMYQFDIVHRCKPKSYFESIYSQKDGQRMMMPYLKDENGHPGCPINGAIEGCFFSSLLQCDSLPSASPFGDVQMIVEVKKILDFKRMNMYFADFYCNQAFAGAQGISSALHYITVVVCEKGSKTDRFCAERLLKLDPLNNKFLKLLPSAGSPRYLTNSTQGLLVEIYYTKPVSLFQAKKFREIATIGKGSSRPMGLPNNKLCKICN